MLTFCWLLWVALAASSAPQPEPIPSFSKEVFPLIKAKCNQAKCHGVQRENPVLTSYDAIKPLTKRILIRVKDRGIPMPPLGSGVVMTKEDIALLEAWIKAGAPKN